MTKARFAGSVLTASCLAAVLLGLSSPGCSPKAPLHYYSDAGVLLPDPPDLSVVFNADDMAMSFPDIAIPCDNLRCKQVDCGETGTTTLTGKVFIPSGEVPLYNVVVYVPNHPELVESFRPGITCDTCGAQASGKPLVVALTDENGHFSIDNMPAGDDIPLIIQLGRWRRQFIIPHVEPCALTHLPDGMLKMPSKKTQGDIPQMAIATGSADPFECLLLKVGLDPAEFTDATGKGRIHVYRENGLDMANPVQPGSNLYASVQQLRKYDVVILPCEGSEHMRTMDQMQHLIDYTSDGGRVFATHYSYTWMARAPGLFPKTGDWQPSQNTPSPDPFHGLIDATFPKGRAFSKWLFNTKASTVLGKLDISEPRHDINGVFKPPSQRWIYGDDKANSTPGVMLHMTFNTPVDLHPPDLLLVPMDGGVPDGGYGGILQCGRVVYSDFHVSTTAVNGQPSFPGACKGGPLTPQEKALTFMLFDLSACVVPDDEIPVEPPVM